MRVVITAAAKADLLASRHDIATDTRPGSTHWCRATSASGFAVVSMAIT
ncbi:MAG: hypothetical protein RLZZ117_1790 [Cyanobacteriota bacterium]|jgi:hypothetical protein